MSVSPCTVVNNFYFSQATVIPVKNYFGTGEHHFLFFSVSLLELTIIWKLVRTFFFLYNLITVNNDAQTVLLAYQLLFRGAPRSWTVGRGRGACTVQGTGVGEEGGFVEAKGS